MKAAYVKLLFGGLLLGVAAAAAYHYGGRYWARQQIDRLVFKDQAVRDLVAADPKLRGQLVETAFLEAACNDDHLAATFVRAGIPATARNDAGLTPLHCAAATGNLAFAKQLAGAGADIRARTVDLALEPIHYAAWYRRWDVLDYLAAEGVSIDEPSKLGPPVALAANEAQVWRPDRLRPDAGNVKRPEVSLAAIVKELAGRGAALDGAGPEGTTLMHWAARRQDVALMDLLTAKSKLTVHVRNRHGQTPLIFALDQAPWAPIDKAHSHVDTIKWLVGHGADVNARDENGKSVALQAVRHPDLLALLMPALDLNVADDQGNSIWTSLSYDAVAFAKSQSSIGLPRTADGRPGRGPLHVSAKEAQADAVAYFLQRGVDPNQVDQDGVTPLHEVLRSSGGAGDARGSRALIVNLLLGAGADANARTNQGQTPLMLAIDQPPEIVSALIAAHANVNTMALENRQMTSILDRYLRRANTAAVELLIKAGARPAAERWNQPQPASIGARSGR